MRTRIFSRRDVLRAGLAGAAVVAAPSGRLASAEGIVARLNPSGRWQYKRGSRSKL